MTIDIPEATLVPVSELRVDGQNPNRMTPKQLERLKTSVEKYGFIVPIITNQDLLVADGEQRLTVATSLGLKQVPVIRLPIPLYPKPIALMRKLIPQFSSHGDCVLDLFGGSGSTLMACEQTGRRCYMMEIDPCYCQVIVDRWEHYTGHHATKMS